MTTPLTRVVRRAGGDAILDRLAELPGADLTTLLLGLFRRRTAKMTPSDVYRRYRSDRFCTPCAVPFERLRATEDRMLSLLPNGFRPVTLAPIAPLGLHSVLGAVHQDKVLSTVRGNEVAADPTNGLTLVAATERQALGPRSVEDVRLATVQRVVRAQMFSTPGFAAHFGLLGLVTAGRDTGDFEFERRSAVEHLRYVADLVPAPTEIRLTAWNPRYEVVCEAIRDALAPTPNVTVTDDPDREPGRDYYTGFAYGAYLDGKNVADGGFTDWTQRLLANRKERLLTCGVGVDRLAMLSGS